MTLHVRMPILLNQILTSHPSGITLNPWTIKAGSTILVIKPNFKLTSLVPGGGAAVTWADVAAAA